MTKFLVSVYLWSARYMKSLSSRPVAAATDADSLFRAKLEALCPSARPGGVSGHVCPRCGSKNWVPSPVWLGGPDDPIPPGYEKLPGRRCHKEDHQCVSCGYLFNIPGIPWGFDNLNGPISIA